jgi:hypothetical protein
MSSGSVIGEGEDAMPLQNRVTPFGDLIATPARGLVYGNRGCLHDDDGRIRRRFAVRRWIACRLRFRSWHRSPLMQPGRFTELFFLDEATAFAAGHRPCALCRREDYVRFSAIWRELHPGDVGADAIDDRLHGERLDPATRGQRRHALPDEPLPDGAFVTDGEEAFVIFGGSFRRWTPEGYERTAARSADPRLLTPPSLVEVLRRGWDPVVPLFHPSLRPSAPVQPPG